MLKKLMKYDLKFIYRFVWIFYVLLLAFSVSARILSECKQTIVIIVIYQIFRGAAFSMIFSGIINNTFGCWRRFRAHLFGAQSYLTHTLPVAKRTIYLSQFFAAIISMFTSVLCGVASILIMFGSKEKLELIKSFIQGIQEIYGLSAMAAIIVFALLLFTQMCFVIQSGYTGLILGHRAQNGKLGKSVLFGFAVYYAFQVFALVALFVYALFEPKLMVSFTSNTVEDWTVMMSVMYGIAALYILGVGALAIWDCQLLKKGVNVE